MDRLIKIEELALTIGSSVQTINNWYRWKKLHPESDFAKMLPDYWQNGPKQTRYWKSKDVWQIVQFKNSIPHGRNGILGEITQKGRNEDGKKDVKRKGRTVHNHKNKGK